MNVWCCSFFIMIIFLVSVKLEVVRYVVVFFVLPFSPGGEVWEAYMEKTGKGCTGPCGRQQSCSGPDNSTTTPVIVPTEFGW